MKDQNLHTTSIGTGDWVMGNGEYITGAQLSYILSLMRSMNNELRITKKIAELGAGQAFGIEHKSTNINLSYLIDHIEPQPVISVKSNNLSGLNYKRETTKNTRNERLIADVKLKINNTIKYFICNTFYVLCRKINTSYFILHTSLNIIILFNHSFGGLSPPKTALGTDF